MKQPESIFKDKVFRDLRKLSDIWFFKTQELSLLGIPDVIGCRHGIFFALELKKDTKSKPSKMQLYILSKITKAGGYGVVTYPENWPSVYDEIKKR